MLSFSSNELRHFASEFFEWEWFLLGEKCPHFGDCLFLTSNSRDKDLLQKYWITKRRIETSDDEGLPELN